MSIRRDKAAARAFAFLLALAVSAGCGREEVSPKPRDIATRSSTRIVRRLDADVRTLNYLLQTSEDERQVLAYLFEPLIALNQDSEPVPGIVAHWEVNDGGREYVLHLDPRATFSDGKPVTASDVRFTLLKILDAPSPQFSSWFEYLDRNRTEVLGQRAIRVAFTTARADQLLAFNISVLPEHIYGTGDFAANAAVVGSGPYVLRRRQAGELVLERRDDYWREKPRIAELAFRPIQEDSVAWDALVRGDLDVARVSNDIWWREKDRPGVTGKLRFVDAWLPSYNCFVWNLDDPLFRDVRVRRALALSFDRTTVISELLHGQARPVTGPFTPDQWANDPTVRPLIFDPRQARALLAEAGWEDYDGDGTLDRKAQRFSFTMLIPAGKIAAEQAQVLQASLRRLGIRMEISSMDGSAFFERVMRRDFQAAFFSWVNEPDPDPYALFHSSQIPPAGLNVAGYTSPEADRLLDAARIEPDRSRRTRMYHELHALLARDQPYLWTVQVATKWAVSRRLENVEAADGLGLFLWYPGPHGWALRE